MNSLEDFIFKKKSKLSIELIQDFIRRNPSLGWKFRNVLVKGLGTESDVGAFKRSHILQLIRDIFSQCHAEADFVDGYVDFMESCANALRDTVTEANKDPRSVSSQKLRELLQFALAAVKQSKKASEIHPSITLIWNSDEWQKLMEELATKEQYNSSKPLLQISQELVKSISSLPRTSKHPPETKKQRAPKPNVPNDKEEGNQNVSASTSQKSNSKKGKKTAKAIVTEEAHEAEEPMKSMSINGSTETREANKKRKGSVPNTNSEDTQNVEDSIPKKKRKKSKITQDS
ncbi:hypothetical protein FRC02_006910 [Tulasnella sp. 418]|nr:hypothetical protein FRC02_006910 [Tulasnella sp. 418]